MLLSSIFIVFGCLFVLALITGKLYVFKLKDTIFVSNYVALMTAFIGMYCIAGFILMFREPFIQLKLLLLFFSLSPFILGQFAAYKTEKFITLLQILIIIASIIVCIHFF